MKKFRCKICGEIVELEHIPEDFICPKCGAPASMFEEIEEVEDKKIPIAEDNPAIVRITEKCINCGRCKDICEQVVGIKYDHKKAKEPVCVHCGQCILNCPVGALVPRYHYKTIQNYLNDTNKIVIVSTSPAVRVALGEEFKMGPGSFVEGKMVSALKRLGFRYVFDTTFGADLTTMEEASELLKRKEENGVLPMFTSCCPAWVKYMEMYHKELLSHLSTCKSPIGMQGTVIKTYVSNLLEIDPKEIINVALTPCTAKKYEIKREELNASAKFNEDETLKDMDYVITTTELALMIKEAGIDFLSLKDEEYDKILNRGSGSGVLFGNTGGVMESALRTAYYLKEKKNPPKDFLQFTKVRGLENLKEATVILGKTTIKVAVANGLPTAIKLLEKLLDGNLEYDFIEVMNCRGGCIGGGGQPLTAIGKQEDIRKERMESIYQKDATDVIRCSYENEDIQTIYQSFFAHPLSKKSEELLHTTYSSKEEILKGYPFNIKN